MPTRVNNIGLGIGEVHKQSPVADLSHRHQRSAHLSNLERGLDDISHAPGRLEVEARLPLVGNPRSIPDDEVLSHTASGGLLKKVSGHIVWCTDMVCAPAIQSHLEFNVDPFLCSRENMAVEVREALHLYGFVPRVAGDYEVLADRLATAVAAGYPTLA